MSGSLQRNTAVMAAGTVVSRITGFGRVLALAYALGASRLTDSFNAANTAPNLVYELVLGGVLSATLIPVIVDELARHARHGEEGEATAWRNISALATAALALLAVLALVFVLAARPVVDVLTILNDTDSAPAQRDVAARLLRLFAPQVLLLGGITLTTALLNVRRRFAAPMWSPILLNLWTIGVLIAYPKVADGVTLDQARSDTRGLLFLGVGVTLGYLVQLLAVIPSVRRANIRLRPVWDPRNEAVRQAARLGGWTMGVVAANLAAYLVIMVLTLGERADFTVYSYAFAFFQLPHAVVAVSIMSALMPDMSERWARGDADGFRAQVSTGLRATAAVLIPAAVGYALLAHPVVRVALEHGLFERRDAVATADVLALFAIGLPGFSGYLLLMRAYQAMKDTRSMFFLYAAENALTIVLALVLYDPLGVPGLAVAFVAPYSLFALIALRRLRVDTAALGRTLARIAVATAAMAAVVAVVIRVVDNDLLRVGSASLAGGTVYVLLARALGVDELVALLRIRRHPA